MNEILLNTLGFALIVGIIIQTISLAYGTYKINNTTDYVNDERLKLNKEFAAIVKDFDKFVKELKNNYK